MTAVSMVVIAGIVASNDGDVGKALPIILMVFLIAGTGGYHNTGKNLTLLKAFYQAGFHVVGVTSPTHTQFVIAASTTGVPAWM